MSTKTGQDQYFEPFLGGGAIFFRYLPKPAILSDSNERLIELFLVVRDEPRALETHLRAHAQAHSKEYYYELRSRELNTPRARAAQFLYLNRTCWNGLYRENKKGQFNVPIGTKDTVLLDDDDFQAWSRALFDVRLEHRDFELAIDEAERGDFIFVDPPYTVRHNMNGFVKYNHTIFAWDDQVRLRAALQRACERGASFAMTNADHDSIRELYADLGKHRQVERYSVIASNSNFRNPSTELLVTV